MPFPSPNGILELLAQKISKCEIVVWQISHCVEDWSSRWIFNLTPAELRYACLCKQCRSRSVGFFRSQLIWIYTVIKYVNLYPQPGSSNLIGWKLKVGVASLLLSCWTRICPVVAYSVDPDHLASSEANYSGSTLFVIKYVNLYPQPGSSNLIGWKLKVGVAS